MADKRTDKDDNVKEDCSWQFIQEKIVRRPLSRRQIIRYIILTVICAVLFGTISAVCFTVTKDNGPGKSRGKPSYYHTKR